MKDPARIAALLLTLPGVVAPFLPFVHFIGPISPLDTILPGSGPFAMLGAPFFLAIPIAFWQARRLFSSRLSSLEIAGAYILSVGATLSVLAFTILILMDIPQTILVLVSLVPWALVVANILVLVRNFSRRLAHEVSAEVFLLGGYLPNAVFCLFVFSGNESAPLQIGACVVAIAGIGYIVSIVMALRSEARPAAALSRLA